MTTDRQTSVSEFTADTTTKTLTRTVTCPLETSQRKTDRVRECIAEWQRILSWAADILPSYSSFAWNRKDTQLYRASVREFPSHSIRAAEVQTAIYKASEAFASWNSNGRSGQRPTYDGSDPYMRIRSDGLSVHQENEAYGLKTKLQPYDPEWFRINDAAYHADYLQRIVDDEARLGDSEIHLTDSGNLTANLTISEDVEVYVADDVSTAVGVDLGENVIFAAAIISGEAVEDVELESGREFRHHREQLKRKRNRLAEQGDLRGVKACRDDLRRYTEQVTHSATRQVIDLARKYSPCLLRLEDLTNYRETAADPIHDWPRAMLKEQLVYKATAAGIPVEFVDPAYTSTTCRNCGQTDQAARNGAVFHCRRCNYQVHADVNAAINIAQRESS